MSDSYTLGSHTFRSRLIIGTGKYASFEETARALEISGTECVTVAVRRIDLSAGEGSLLDFLDDLTNWYIRRSRRRFWKSGDDANLRAALHTLHECVHAVMRLAAPALPFITEDPEATREYRPD